MQRQIDELMSSAAFADAIRGAGLTNFRITLHNPSHGLAYVTGVAADGKAFDIEMALFEVFKQPDPGGLIVADLVSTLRLAR